MSNAPSLLGCPFCGAPASGYPIEAHQHSSFLKNIVGVPDHGGSYVIEGNCACGSGLIGETEAEVTERWNRRTPQPVVREPLTCEWTHNDDDGYWDTSCGKAWGFDDGGPKENNMNFCHCCGKTLRIKGGQP